MLTKKPRTWYSKYKHGIYECRRCGEEFFDLQAYSEHIIYAHRYHPTLREKILDKIGERIENFGRSMQYDRFKNS